MLSLHNDSTLRPQRANDIIPTAGYNIQYVRSLYILPKWKHHRTHGPRGSGTTENPKHDLRVLSVGHGILIGSRYISDDPGRPNSVTPSQDPKALPTPAISRWYGCYMSPKDIILGWRGGATVGRRTSDHEVVSSIPSRGVAA